MTPLSSRYAGVLIALFALAIVPIAYHAIRQPVQEDCANADAFFAARRIGGARVVETSPSLAKLQAVEGRFLGEQGGVRVARVEGPGEFMGSPFDIGFEPPLYIGSGELRWVEAEDTRIPTRWHALRTPSVVVLEAYTYTQGGRTTTHPLRTSAALLWDQLLHGTRPLTVLIVGAAGRRDEQAKLEREIEATFARTWRQLDAACRAGS